MEKFTRLMSTHLLDKLNCDFLSILPSTTPKIKETQQICIYNKFPGNVGIAAALGQGFSTI